MTTIRKVVTGVFLGVCLTLWSTSGLAQCAENNGDRVCTGVVGKQDFTYSICDVAAPYIARLVAWCKARNGTWLVNAQGGYCEGQDPVPESSGGQEAAGERFVTEMHGQTCGASSVAPACNPDYCPCDNIMYGNVPTREITLNRPFTGMSKDSMGICNQPWGERIMAARHQTAGCPQSFSLVSTPSGPMCEKLLPCNRCEERVGNPVDVGSGDKLQREPDYVSAAPGGLEFVRHYNSGGFFDTAQRTVVVNTDVWRHSYSARVLAYPTNAYVMAAVQRPDGQVRIFTHAGVEKHNQDGAAWKLEKVPASGTQTGWKVITDQKDIENYDLQGRLTSVARFNGFITTLAYDAQGRLETVTDTFGRSITLGYDTGGQLTTMTDPSSRTYQYGYDTKGRLTSVMYPDGKTRSYVYENASFTWALTGIIDERGVRLSTYGYDGAGRSNLTERSGFDQKHTVTMTLDGLTRSVNVIDAFGASHTYTYNKAGGVLRLTSHAINGLNSISHTYDTNGNRASTTDRRGTVTNYTYDLTRNLETSRTEAAGTALARTITTTWHSTLRLPATVTEPSGVSGVNLVTEFTYNTAGHLTKKKLTAGTKVREWNYTVNTRGQVLTIDGPRTDVSDVTTIAYYSDTDSCTGCRGQVYTVTNALGQITTFNSYDADGRPTQISDVNGVATTLTYHTRGWLASRSVAGETTSYDYDFKGNLKKVTLPDGSWLIYQYDAADGLIAIEDRLGNSIDYELDVMGNRVAEWVTDPNGVLKRELQRVYDGFNRLQKDLGAAGQTTQYESDGNRNVTKVTDPLSRVTTNTYDALNRLTNVNDAANGNTVFTYDAKDRLKTVKDPKISATTTYTYNGLGDLESQISPDTGTTSFTHDAAGNVLTQTDARSVTTSYTYDALNRVTAATVTDGTVTYEYDNLTTGGAYARGRLTKVTDPSGNTTYAYDAMGRITSKVQTTTATPANKSFTVAYAYSNGRLASVTYPSGRIVAYGYDLQGQVTSITVDGTTTLLSGATWSPFGPVRGWTWGNGQTMDRSYDLDGRVKSVTLGPSTASYADLSQVFGYDSLNRLSTAALAAGQTQGFGYDANSNRTSHTVNASTTNYSYPTTSHKLSSLSGATTRSFSYDSAGNTTASAGITYVYDGRGRMKQAGATTYLVNGVGQRVKKATAGTDLFFAYDESGRLLGEYDSTGAPVQETVWLGDLPVNVIKPKTGGFDVFYIWADHLGTPRLITDITNVSRWEWAHNDPFGNNAPNENPAGAGIFAFNLRLPGQYYDVESGLNYNYFRDYDASLGRYIQSDPIGLKGGSNTYAYVDSQPLLFTDPYGLWRWPGKIFDDALRDSSRSGLPGPHNGLQDAYRHCLASCESVRENGEMLSQCLGWANEKKGDWRNNQERGERSMDDFNNSIGFAFGKGARSYQACQSLCMSAATRGHLRTHQTGSSRGYWR